MAAALVVILFLIVRCKFNTFIDKTFLLLNNNAMFSLNIHFHNNIKTIYKLLCLSEKKNIPDIFSCNSRKHC